MRDTIVKIIDQAPNLGTNEAELYRELINSQTQTYNLIVFVFMGLVTIFAAATWWFNTRTTKQIILKKTEEIFENEREKLLNKVTGGFSGDIDNLKVEIFRLFAMSNEGPSITDHCIAFGWWMMAMEINIRRSRGVALRNGIDRAIKKIEYLIKTDKTKALLVFKDPINFIDRDYVAIVEKIPDTLMTERVKLQKLIIELFGDSTDSKKDNTELD